MNGSDLVSLLGVSDVRLVDAYWLDSPHHDTDTCVWCARLMQADAAPQAGQPQT